MKQAEISAKTEAKKEEDEDAGMKVEEGLQDVWTLLGYEAKAVPASAGSLPSGSAADAPEDADEPEEPIRAEEVNLTV